jgi:hypothetical protein
MKSLAREIARAQAVIDPGPCQGCRFNVRCGAKLLACDRFSMFSLGLPRSRWLSAPTAPTRIRYQVLFGR